jgi:hypothetical protein
VSSKEANDGENIALIREHLAKEAPLFAKGNFADPAYLHGDEMASLAALQAAGQAGKLNVRYEELPSGAQLVYTSDDAEVVVALHLWFQAQVSDHGEHAVSN